MIGRSPAPRIGGGDQRRAGYDLRSLTIVGGSALWSTEIDSLIAGAVEFWREQPRRLTDMWDGRRRCRYRWTPARRLVVSPYAPQDCRPIRIVGVPPADLSRAGALAFRLLTEHRRAPSGMRHGVVDDGLVAWWTTGRTPLVMRRWIDPARRTG